MADVFISYSREDGDRAQRLAQVLEAQGISTWWDREIPPGSTWDQVIGKALGEARCVVVLWTRESILSNWVKEEASRGMRRAALVPVVFDHVEPPLGFGRIEAAELSDWTGDNDDPELVNFLRAVQAMVGSPTQGSAPGALEGVSEKPRAPRRHRAIPRRLLALLLIGLVVIAGGVGWWIVTQGNPRLEVQIWNVEGDHESSIFASRTFDIPARGGGGDEALEPVARWVADKVAPDRGTARPPVTVRLSVPADLRSGGLSVRAEPEIPLITHLYVYRGEGKSRVRIRSDLDSETLALLDSDFVIEIGAAGYGSVPVAVTRGEPLEKTLTLSAARAGASLAVAEFAADENRIAQRLAHRLAQEADLSVAGPDALQRLREEIAASRDAVGMNIAIQATIRDSLGVDFIVRGAYFPR